MKKYYLLTPGPTPIPPEVASKEALPILHHRTTEFGAVFTEVLDLLRYAFQTKNDVLLLAGSGTGGMESAVANVLSSGEEAIVAACGAFGERWGKILESFGAKPIYVRDEWGHPTDIRKVADALQAHPKARAVFATHTETSTGVVNDVPALGELTADREAILVLDAISGLGGQELWTDAWKVDVVVTGSQKGLMNAPGLAMVSVSPKAWKVVENAKASRFYWDWRRIKKSIGDKETPFTPPVTLVVSLLQSLRNIKTETIEKIWERHAWLANATREGLTAIGLELFAKKPCNVLTAVSVPPGMDSKMLVRRMREEYGVSIAGGQEHLLGKIIRLAHMGYMDRFDILIGISAIEMMLAEMRYPVELGKGVSAAERALLTDRSGLRAQGSERSERTPSPEPRA